MSDREMQQCASNPFSPESWEYAIAFADSLGRPPSSITFLVRSLLSDHERSVGTKGPVEVGRDSRMFLNRFLKSKAFQAPYFHAVSMFRPERLGSPDDPFLPRDFIESFSCMEHAVVSALIFMHRMARHTADEGLVRDVTELFQRGLNLGWFVGKTLRPVGADTGMLVGGVRWLGLFPLLRHDREGFRSYLRQIKRSGKAVTDVRFETEMWGCASIQIALILLQRIGFTSNRLVPLMRALTTTTLLNSVEPLEKASRVAEIWIRFMLESQSAPSTPLQPAYYLSAERINEISERVLRAPTSVTLNWLSATPRELTPESAPQIFCEAAQLKLDADESSNEATDEIAEGIVAEIDEVELEDDALA